MAETVSDLARLREAGWSVAVHNDYQIDGARKTFWLFTHPSGVWAKGEGSTDKEAVEIAAIAAWNRRATDPAVAELVEALQLVRGIIKDAAMEGFNYQYGDWADRLFRSQADTHAVLAKHAAQPQEKDHG